MMSSLRKYQTTVVTCVIISLLFTIMYFHTGGITRIAGGFKSTEPTISISSTQNSYNFNLRKPKHLNSQHENIAHLHNPKNLSSHRDQKNSASDKPEKKKDPVKPIDEDYLNICYLTVSDKEACKEMCNLDQLCQYSYFYTKKTTSNCFMRVGTQCVPATDSTSLYQLKDKEALALSVDYNVNTTMDTPVCHKPLYHPFDSSLKKIVDRKSLSKIHKCNKVLTKRFQIVSDSIQLSVVETGVSCKFRYIYRTDKETRTDDDYSLTDWIALSDKPIPLTDEFAEIVCEKSGVMVYRDYLAYIPKALAEKRAEQAKTKSAQVKTKSVKGKPSRRFKEKLNVMFFGVDSTSVSQGYRQLPKTLGYLRQNMNAVTFQGYNRIQDNTFMNLYTMLTGMPIVEDVGIDLNRFYDKDPLFFKWFKNDGFVTGYYEDYKQGALFNWLKKGFQYKPAVHYARPFNVAVENYIGRAWVDDYCYLDKGTHVWCGDWSKSFVSQYTKLNQPFLLWSWITVISHESTNTLGLADPYLYSLFKSMHESNYFNNTIFIFYSDHGYRYGGLRATMVGQHEENHPMMNVVFPPWFKKKYQKDFSIFKENAEKRLSSPYDIHRTVLEFADGALESAKAAGMKSFGKNLFEPVDEMRNCSIAGIPDHFCGCRHTVPHPADDKLTQVAAQAIVDRVNEINKVEEAKCLKYTLKSVIVSYKSYRHDIKDRNVQEMAVTIEVTPSAAQFSATVHIYADNKPAKVKGISRVSLYGSSANCVSDFRLRLYCTCKGYY